MVKFNSIVLIYICSLLNFLIISLIHKNDNAVIVAPLFVYKHVQIRTAAVLRTNLEQAPDLRTKNVNMVHKITITEDYTIDVVDFRFFVIGKLICRALFWQI